MDTQTIKGLYIAGYAPVVDIHYNKVWAGVGLLMFLAAGAAFWLGARTPWEQVGLRLLWFGAGLALAVGAGLLLFFRLRQLYFIPTSSIVRHSIYYMDAAWLPQLIRALDGMDLSALPGVPLLPSGNGRMEVLMSDDHCFCVIQLWRYAPYAYRPVSPIYTIPFNKGEQMYRYLTSLRGMA